MTERLCACGCARLITSRRKDAMYALPACRLRAFRARGRPAAEPSAGAAVSYEAWAALVPVAQWLGHLVACLDADHEDAARRKLTLPDKIHAMRWYGHPVCDLSEEAIRAYAAIMDRAVDAVPKVSAAAPVRVTSAQLDIEAAIHQAQQARAEELATVRAELAETREALASERFHRGRAEELAELAKADARAERAAADRVTRLWRERGAELDALRAQLGGTYAPGPRVVREVQPAQLILIDVLGELPADIEIGGRKPATWAKLIPQGKAPAALDADARARHLTFAGGAWWAQRPHWRHLEALGLFGLHGRDVVTRLEGLERETPRALDDLAQLLAGRRDFGALTKDRPRRLAALVLAHRRPTGSPVPAEHPAGPDDAEEG